MRSTNLILLRALSLTMQTQIKRYNILLRGKVQHIGYRGIIEGTARKLDIRGYVFNDTDGSMFLMILMEVLRLHAKVFRNQ